MKDYKEKLINLTKAMHKEKTSDCTHIYPVRSPLSKNKQYYKCLKCGRRKGK